MFSVFLLYFRSIPVIVWNICYLFQWFCSYAVVAATGKSSKNCLLRQDCYASNRTARCASSRTLPPTGFCGAARGQNTLSCIPRHSIKIMWMPMMIRWYALHTGITTTGFARIRWSFWLTITMGESIKTATIIRKPCAIIWLRKNTLSRRIRIIIWVWYTPVSGRSIPSRWILTERWNIIRMLMTLGKNYASLRLWIMRYLISPMPIPVWAITTMP